VANLDSWPELLGGVLKNQSHNSRSFGQTITGEPYPLITLDCTISIKFLNDVHMHKKMFHRHGKNQEEWKEQESF
jgi:hypothetical protein